jgi:circadian clock protein KaiC
MRGTNYSQGQVYFKITSAGIDLYPRLNAEITDKVYVRDYSKRVSIGVPDIDAMMGGGIPTSSITMISGGAGTGKTILSINFAYDGLMNGESVVYVTFEENPVQLINSALSLGMDLRPYIDSNQLKLIHVSPVELDVDEHLFMLQHSVVTLKAGRIVIDSISSFELGIQDKIKYTDFIFTLTNFFRTTGVTVCLTHELHHSGDVSEFTKHGISFVADNLILLEMKEIGMDIKRVLRIVKVRASKHEMGLKEFTINNHSVEIVK